jgi:hypothetical protein
MQKDNFVLKTHYLLLLSIKFLGLGTFHRQKFHRRDDPFHRVRLTTNFTDGKFHRRNISPTERFTDGKFHRQ